MRPKVFIGFLVPFSCLSLHNFSSAQNISDKIKRFVHGEADTLFSFRPEARNIVIFNGGYSLVIREKDSIRKKNNPVFTLIDPNGEVTWDTLFKYWGSCQLTSDELGPPKVRNGYYLGESQGGETEIFNHIGTRLAKVWDETVLRSSPNGVYFHNFWSGMEYTKILRVYDSIGNPLWSKEAYSNYFWEAAALDDSLILFYDKNLFLFDAKRGDTVVDLSDTVEAHRAPYSEFAISKNGRYFALYGNGAHFKINALLSFDKNGKLLWATNKDETVGRLEETALDPDGTILATLEVRGGRPTQYTLNFIENLNGGRSFAKFQVETEGIYVSSPWKSLAIFDNFATILLPSGYDCLQDQGVTLNTRTKCFIFDSSKTSVVDTFSVKGYLSATTSKAYGTRYVRAVYDDEGKRIFLLRSK